ncbi:MAG TPA: hypothetical protein VFA26_22385, partial [Gemmataceae bacterium]|nr:hypothetical protein [Gemmataceae bacterium]
MAVWRIPAVALVLAVAAGSAAAQNHTLAEPVKAGDCFRYQIDMSLAGEMRFQQDGKATTRKLAATASHQFPERVLAAASTGLAEKTARRYETAKAVITLGNDKTERTLRAERRLIVAQRHKDDFVVYCPGGPLTREELELVAEHFDTLALTGLLPGKAAAVGDTWKIPNAVAQALCNFEGLTEQSLTGKLEEVQGDTARLSVTGTASGIEQGALAKLTIKATCRFDLKAKRLTAVEWSQTDERDQGPASPAAATQITVTLKRTAIEEPSSLSDVALVSVPQGL